MKIREWKKKIGGWKERGDLHDDVGGGKVGGGGGKVGIKGEGGRWGRKLDDDVESGKGRET